MWRNLSWLDKFCHLPRRAYPIATDFTTSVGNVTLPPWLSVVIPSYRGERWIGTALASIAAEGARGVEVLVIDSSPTSAALDVADGYADRLSLRTFHRTDLASWHEKTNFGVEQANSEHVCWLGVDDVWLPGRLRAVREWIDSAPEAGLHLGPSRVIDETGRSLGLWRCPLPMGNVPSELALRRLLVQNFIAAPAPVFRRDAWLTCGGLDPALWYTADWDVWLKLAAAGSVWYHPDVTIGFRIHADSLTMTGRHDAAAFARQMQTVLDRHLPRLDAGQSMGVERVARASIAVNTALARASAGGRGGLGGALLQVLRLGPSGIRCYLRDSRIVERAWPRLRARMAGAL